MSSDKASGFSSLLKVLVLLTGWMVAGVVYFRSSPPTAPPVHATPAPEGRWSRLFREWVAHPQLTGSLVAFCLLDEEGRVVFESPLASTALCPASALKTVTTGAAFDILGPDFRFETVLAATSGVDAAGVLAGDLVLVGGGDPTFSSEDLGKLADAVVAAGLKRVSGRLTAETSVFPADPMSEHWNWGDIGNGYGAGAFGLNLDHNRISIRFEPGAQVGAPVSVAETVPSPRQLRWENFVVTGPPDSGDEVVVYSEPYGQVVTLRGSIPAGASGFTVSGALPDPPAQAIELLRERLAAAGVTFGDEAIQAVGAERKILARHQSAPLREIIAHTHEASDNLEAQCLFLTIGQRRGMPPADAIRQHWEAAGVQFVGLRLIDGSGLARANMIRPLDLARVNLAARRGKNGQQFFESLSSYVKGNARGKIGGMSGVKTQVGFLRTAQGRELTYALMGNGLAPGREFWGRLEELLEQVRTLPQ